MKAKDTDRPLTESERKEREEARRKGEEMAKETIKKLEPQIKAVADVINKANDRIYEDGRKAGIREVVEWIDRNFSEDILELANKFSIPTIYMHTHRWQAKLKDWGL